jgi:hypothetical protein
LLVIDVQNGYDSGFLGSKVSSSPHAPSSSRA